MTSTLPVDRTRTTRFVEVSVTHASGLTPLMSACSSLRGMAGLADGKEKKPGDEVIAEIVRLLLDKGAKVNVKDDAGWTPLIMASMTGFVKTVNILIEHKADMEARDLLKGEAPLSWAAEMGHVEVVKALLVKGADPGAKDKAGQTALDHAKKNEHSKVVEVLKKAKSK